MNKRQRKKQFKKIHGMNPKQYFIEKTMPETVKLVIRSTDGVIRTMCRVNKSFYEISRIWANANLLRSLTAQRLQGKRKKGKW